MRRSAFLCQQNSISQKPAATGSLCNTTPASAMSVLAKLTRLLFLAQWGSFSVPRATKWRERVFTMAKKMLVDATHPEETRVAIIENYRDTNRLIDLDFGMASKPVWRGNICLAKVIRVEASLQACFVEYGGNRHGFLPFSEIHPDYFRIPVADRHKDDDQPESDTQPEAQPYPDAPYPSLPDQAAPDFAENSVPATSGENVQPQKNLAESFAQSPSQTQVTQANVGNADFFSTPAQDVGHLNQPENANFSFFDPQPSTLTDPFAPAESTDPFAAPESQNITSPTNDPFFQPHIDEQHSEDILATSSNFLPAPDQENGLITDFGTAALSSPGIGEQPTPHEQAHVDSVGGEMTERFVRQHRPRYKIQEVIQRGQVMLVQVVKEERGNKGAALTTFLSLAGRYCVLMPNTDHGGGVSRKITNHQDRRRMKEILDQLEIPEGMAVILRTAGMEQEPPEIQRDLNYLLRMWDSIREQTLQSVAPSLIYEEANLIKRSVRDLYSQDISEILVAGEDGYNRTREFMCAIMPDDVEKIRLYNDPVPLFFRYNVENQIDSLHNPIVQLRSGGYLVINPTEALVSIDVNSGRATRERHIEETAVKTNLEAADEVARQLRLRDLAGLVVIDFIDMEEGRNNAAVERRLKEAMKNDRARLQIGRISPFGLMELSRQRLRPSLLETNFEKCPHCAGVGFIRSVDSAALSILRAIEEEGIRQRSSELVLHVATKIALYILNQKRATLSTIEQRYDLHVLLHSDDSLVPPDYRLERIRQRKDSRRDGPAVNSDQILADTGRNTPQKPYEAHSSAFADASAVQSEAPLGATADTQNIQQTTGQTPDGGNAGSEGNSSSSGFGRRRFSRNRRDRFNQKGAQNPESQPNAQPAAAQPTAFEPQNIQNTPEENNELSGQDFVDSGEDANSLNDGDNNQRRRRRGRRGGRRRNGPDNRSESGQQVQPQKFGNRWGNRPQSEDFNAGRQNYSAPQDFGNNAVIPASILDIDTTPRAHTPMPAQPEYNRPSVAPQPRRTQNVPEAPQAASPHIAQPAAISSAAPPKMVANNFAQAEPKKERPPASYEIVNPPSEKPKGGWWRRLTGQ